MSELVYTASVSFVEFPCGCIRSMRSASSLTWSKHEMTSFLLAQSIASVPVDSIRLLHHAFQALDP